ncbi:MAG: hypothetical protein MK165_02005 [Pirellulaceae bacterium]|nr:hypothetical protein [Pirellulaceae bacterium]
MILRCTAAGLIVFWALLVSSSRAQEKIVVVVGANAPELEKFAAAELATQWERLYSVDADVSTDIRGNRYAVLVGSPATNPHVKRVLDGSWPQVSDQGIVLKSYRQGDVQGVVVGGGSAVATLWAAYEWGYQHGIRYMFHGDFYPVSAPADYTSDVLNLVMEPKLRVRTWRTVNDFAIGPESWGLADLQALIKQLAKMKFNRVMLSVYPWQPFVHYEFGDVKKETAMHWYGDKFRVDGDVPGKRVFDGAAIFENPDFVGTDSYQKKMNAGIKHARGIMQAAQSLGMTAAISMSPGEFPREFSRALPGSQEVHQLKRLTIGPGPQVGPDDKLFRELVSTKIRAFIETYPELDALYIGMPEFPEWSGHFEEAWDELSGGDGEINGLTLAEVIQTAAERNLIASAERGIQAIKGNIAPLAFFKSLFADQELLKRADGGQVQLVLRSIDPALYPILDQVIPRGAATLNFVDYTSRRVVENRQLLAEVPSTKVPASLILTLADDNVGVLAQSATSSIHELVTDLRHHGWEGFSTRYWMLAELDPTVHYLSRAAFSDDVTVRSAHDELFMALTGKRDVADRLWLAFQYIEQATTLIDEKDIGFGFPVQGMLMKHYSGGPAPAWWAEASELYTKAMIELYRSHDGTHPRARPVLFYYAKRSEYVLEYLAAVSAVRAAGVAKAKDDQDAMLEQLEIAVESMYNAIDTLSDVVRDQSDRGLIAVLINHAYRPLYGEYERALELADQ